MHLKSETIGLFQTSSLSGEFSSYVIKLPKGSARTDRNTFYYKSFQMFSNLFATFIGLYGFSKWEKKTLFSWYFLNIDFSKKREANTDWWVLFFTEVHVMMALRRLLAKSSRSSLSDAVNAMTVTKLSTLIENGLFGIQLRSKALRQVYHC